jgi:tol-pal system protein YbgF
MIRGFLAPVLTLLMAGALAAQASAATKEQLQMMADLRMLQQQSQELQLLLGSVTEALKAINARLDQQTDATRKSFADQKLTIDVLSKDLSVIREKVDDSNVRVGTLSQEVDALRQSVVALSTAPPPPPVSIAEGTVPPSLAPAVDGQDPASPTAAAGASAPPPSAAPTASPGVVSSPQRMWNSAFADYTAGDYDLAILGFEAYVRTFPKSEMADDAQVHICTAYSNEGKYEMALEACETAIRTYPSGSAIPEAYYRKATALQGLQRPDAAREAFEHLLKTYPDSPEATLAQQRLEGLKRPQP